MKMSFSGEVCSAQMFYKTRIFLILKIVMGYAINSVLHIHSLDNWERQIKTKVTSKAANIKISWLLVNFMGDAPETLEPTFLHNAANSIFCPYLADARHSNFMP